MSPTQRTLKKLRDAGWMAAVTERWNPHVRIRQDLFGFIDVVAVKANCILAVQSTTGDHVANRLAKIQANPKAEIWLSSSSRGLVVHGWRKVGARGRRKTWECREVPVLPHQFSQAQSKP